MDTKLLAQAWIGLQKANSTDSTADIATIGSLTSLFTNILQAIAVFAGIVFFIMMLVGGFSFLFSGGDQKKLEKAKGTLTNAIIGLIILIGGYLIICSFSSFSDLYHKDGCSGIRRRYNYKLG